MRALKFLTFIASLMLLLGALLLSSFLPLKNIQHWRVRALSLWAKLILKVFSIQVLESPQDGSTKSAHMIVANHVSYLDIPVLLARQPSLFLGKQEVASWPLMGFLGKLAGMLFVDRASLWSRAKSILNIQEKIQAGLSVVVFPEGTTTTSGPLKGRVPFFAGAFRVSRMEGVPLELVHLEYDCNDMCAWVGDQDFLSHLWQFLGRKQTTVRLRSHWVQSISTRRQQRQTHEFARAWMCEGGRELMVSLGRSPF